MICEKNNILQFLAVAFLWTFASCSAIYFKPKGARPKLEDTYPFQNTSLPWDERVDDLVLRLTLEEIQLQMARGGTGPIGGPAPAIPRLGIGPYNWATECLRGDVGAPGNATAFPQAIGLGATFSPDLVQRVAAATGAEVRGKHNDFVKQGIYLTHTGASCFSPVINIVRDPRWGRTQETYGEDPFLTGILSQSFVRGLQGNDSRFVQATAGCKHFDVHGGPENIPVSRFSFNAEVSDVDWRSTFLPAFKKCVEAGTFGLMCSYNRINGVPACANPKLLTDILRNEWNFKGYVISDQAAIENIIDDHHYLNNSVDTVAACVNAGTNLELSSNLENPVYMSLIEAITQGKVSVATVVERVKPLFYTRMRLGEFDPPEKNPFAQLNSSISESPEHQALAIEAAVKSFVLLKNENKFLPLKSGLYKNVAIVGPMADNVEQLFGDYSPVQDRSFTKTPLQGLQELFSSIKYGQGCKDGTPCTNYDSANISNAVKGADLVFIALGTGQAVEAEGRDRKNIYLPGSQEKLGVDAITMSGQAPIVLLLFSAGPLNVTYFDKNDRVSAILECFLPAQATGDAIANVLTNKDGKSSPAGRLPVTWYYYDWQIPPMVNYSMTGRTYRYMEADPLYPFGYGLSYSTFEYDIMLVEWNPNQPTWNMTVVLLIVNTGSVDADEVIQCYIEWVNKSLPVPKIQLTYFDRINIPAAAEIQHEFLILSESWAYWENNQWNSNPGQIILYCGGQQPNQTRSISSNVLSAELYFNTTTVPDRSDRSDNAHAPMRITASAKKDKKSKM